MKIDGPKIWSPEIFQKCATLQSEIGCFIMDLEKPKKHSSSQDADEALERLLDRASSPADNLWFATQVLNRLREETPVSHETFWVKLRRAVSMPRNRLAAGAFAVFVCTILLFKAAIPSDLSSPSNDFIAMPSSETTEIPDELIVADLEIFMAELNSELWQDDISL